MRIADLLADQRIDFEALPHPPAYSAQKRAKYLRVPGREVAKCVLLRGPSDFLLAILPATQQVDTELLSRHLHGPVRLATDQEVTEMFCDCEWGVVPPFGTQYGIPTLLDDTIHPDSLIVLETHTHFEAIRMRCRDFEHLEHPRRLRLARPMCLSEPEV